jgi:osmotically-inducible protein OsmY
MGVARKLLPFSRVGMAMWAWRNRNEIGSWAVFASRAVPQVAGGERDDVMAEARLRAKLTRDPLTRNLGGAVSVSVDDGVATLQGRVRPEVADRVVALAERTTGVHRLRDELEIEGRRGRFSSRR